MTDWKILRQLAAALVLLASLLADGASAAPRPPGNLMADDAPGDVGTRVDLKWTLSPDDVAGADPRLVTSYQIFRKEAGEEEFVNLDEEATYQRDSFTDTSVERGKTYFYHVRAAGPEGEVSEASNVAGPVIPKMEWFDTQKAWYGIILLIVCGAVMLFIQVARSGRDLKVRKIAGLEAVDEAVGRATEMGRTCLFVPGILDINDIQTIAGLTILSRVARVAAEYDARIEVPTARSLVMATAREAVESSFLAAGRPDAYNEDDIYYLTDEQFGYVAGVSGTMVREKPAACFYMGAFFAESLLLAETGNSVGAIQVAGTAMPSQLPFFVAACDYTLIGEEFFAASAYLSGEPQQLGSLKGQDVGKVLGVGLLLAGCVLATAAQFVDLPLVTQSLSFLTNNVLGAEGFLP